MIRQLLIASVIVLSTESLLLAAPVPLNGNAPVAVERLRVNNPAVVPMTGLWHFELQHGRSPSAKAVLPESTNADEVGFAAASLDDSAWKTIPVPANWEIEGFSRPTFQDRGNNPSDDIGLYRRWMDVPAKFAGQRVFWHFDGVYDGAEVFVNGQRVGYHESGFTAFDMDVTDALQPGKSNLFAVRVYKLTPTSSLDKGDFWCLGGVYRDNYLVALPPLHVDDVTLTTDLDAQYKNATLNAQVRVVGTAGTRIQLAGELYGLDGKKVSMPAILASGEIGADGAGVLTLAAPVESPKLWSAEKPNLYYVLFRLTGPAGEERTQERFGFRKIENRSGVVLWNGVPIKCTGTCRHEEFSPFGHALNDACWKTDIALMKAADINAIRTSHYNHAARFLELCDEAGFYVLDEVPFCWVGNEINDTSRQWAYTQRARETLARDKNRTCVLAWSIGNENGYGSNAQAAFNYMKTNDPTRLDFISQQGLGPNPLTDFEDSHYPSLDNLKRIVTAPSRAKVPAIFTEEPHTFCTAPVVNYDYGEEDFWGQALVNIWDIVWPTDKIIGSFVWEWQDQGMADKFPDRSGVNAQGMRDENNKGIVTSTRQLKPAYWQLKMVYSPVTTTAKEIDPAAGKCVVPMQNRFSFTDLSELTCRWEDISGGKVIADGESHIACPPRTSTNASFLAKAGTDTLRMEFIHPDGRSLYVTDLHTKGYAAPAAPAPLLADGPVKLSQTDDTVTVQAAGTELKVDKHTGQITSWRAGGQDVVTAGPVLNLGEALGGGRGGRGGRAGGGGGGRGRGAAAVSSAQAPQLKNAAVFANMVGDLAHIVVTNDVYLAESPELKGQLTYTMDISKEAEVNFTWSLGWKGTNATAVESGVKFILPAGTDKMSWLRDSRWSEYPPDHIGEPSGSVASDDISFRSSKRDLRWMAMSGGGKYSLVALAAGAPLAGRARADGNATTFYLTSAIAAPTGELSLNSVPGYDIRLTPDTPIGGAFRLRVAAQP